MFTRFTAGVVVALALVSPAFAQGSKGQTKVTPEMRNNWEAMSQLDYAMKQFRGAGDKANGPGKNYMDAKAALQKAIDDATKRADINDEASWQELHKKIVEARELYDGIQTYFYHCGFRFGYILVQPDRNNTGGQGNGHGAGGVKDEAPKAPRAPRKQRVDPFGPPLRANQGSDALPARPQMPIDSEYSLPAIPDSDTFGKCK